MSTEKSIDAELPYSGKGAAALRGILEGRKLFADGMPEFWLQPAHRLPLLIQFRLHLLKREDFFIQPFGSLVNALDRLPPALQLAFMLANLHFERRHHHFSPSFNVPVGEQIMLLDARSNRIKEFLHQHDLRSRQ